VFSVFPESQNRCAPSSEAFATDADLTGLMQVIAAFPMSGHMWTRTVRPA
jgi:hypothetical protein